MTEEELIIFCIGCLISADNNFNNEQRSENIRALKMLLTNKKVKLKKNHKEAIEKGIQILEHEIEENKEY